MKRPNKNAKKLQATYRKKTGAPSRSASLILTNTRLPTFLGEGRYKKYKKINQYKSGDCRSVADGQPPNTISYYMKLSVCRRGTTPSIIMKKLN